MLTADSQPEYSTLLSRYQEQPAEYRLLVSKWRDMDWRARILYVVCCVGLIAMIFPVAWLGEYVGAYAGLLAMLVGYGVLLGAIVTFHRLHNAHIRSRRWAAAQRVDRFLGRVGFCERMIYVPALEDYSWHRRDRHGRVVDWGSSASLPEGTSQEVRDGVRKFGYEKYKERATMHNQLSTQLNDYRAALASRADD